MPQTASRRRRWRWLLLPVALPTALALLALLALSLPPLRKSLLETALQRADAALPGSFAVSSAAWPEIGRLRLEGVLWRDGRDTLLACDALEIAVDLPALALRALELERLVLSNLRLDLPAIEARFPPSAGPPKRDNGTGFLRAGSLPGLSALACRELRLTAGPLRIDSLRSVTTLRLAGGFDIVDGHAPWLRLDELDLRLPQDGLAASGQGLLLEPESGRLSGSLAAELGPNRRFALRISAPARDRYRLEGELNWEGAPVALALGGAVIREDGRAAGLTASGALRLPSTTELRQAGFASPTGLDLPNLSLTLDGELAFDSGRESRLRVEIDANSAGLAGGVRLSRQDESLRADGLRLSMDGLALTGELGRSAGRLEGSARLEVGDGAWLARFGVEPPEALRARLDGRLSGEASAPALSVELSASGRQRALTLDTLRLSASRPGGPESDWRISARAEAFGQRLQTALALSFRDGTTAALDTLRLTTAADPRPAGSGGGRLALGPGGDLRLADLVLAGEGFDVRLDGERRPDGTGSFDVALTVPTAPEALLARLALPDSLARELVRGWADGPTPRVTGRIELAPPEKGGPVLHARATALLPGPPRLAALLPADARLDGLGDLELDGDWDGRSGRLALRARGAGWLDSLDLQAWRAAAGWRLDTLSAALPGLAIAASGDLRGDTLALTSRVGLVETALLARLLPDLAPWQPRLRLDLRADGPVRLPELSARLQGELRGPGLIVDTLALDLSRDADRLLASLRLPKGLQAGGRRLSFVAGDWSSAGSMDSLFPGQLDLRFSADGWHNEQTLTLARDDAWRLNWSRFDLTVGTRALGAAVPFSIVKEVDGVLSLTDLELAGELGRLSGSFRLGGSEPFVRMNGRLGGLGTLLAGRLPEALLPDGIEFAVEAAGDSLHASRVRVEGLPLRPKKPVDLEIGLDGPLAAPDFTLLATDEADTLLAGSGALPGSLSLSPPGFTLRPERLAFDLHADRLPLPLDAFSPSMFQSGERGRLSGRLAFRGGLDQPSFDGALKLDFAEARRLRDWSLRLDADLSDLSTAEPRLQSTLRLIRDSRPVLTGKGRLPLHRDSAGVWRAGKLDARLDGDSLDFARFNDWLPSDLWLEGRGAISLLAEGPLRDPRLSGTVRVPSVKIGQATGTRLFASGDLRLSGRLRKPVIDGWLALDNGVVAIPDLPRNLHPVDGVARLWALRPPQHAEPVTRPRFALADSLVLDVDLRVPRTIHFEGRDLSLGASGELQLSMRQGQPRVTGQLEASSGRFRLLSRSIDVRSGQVTFYGDDALDPTLNLELGAAIDGSDILVSLSGTFLQPQLVFRSEPPMDEGEILALLLFGRPSEELDVDQQTLLQQRATQMATDYGMARLNARLARDLGVDLLRYQADGVGGRSSLEVGKYIGPRVFVRYEQALDQQNLFRLQLDYVLTKRLRLESSYGRQSQSGLQLNWTKSY